MDVMTTYIPSYLRPFSRMRNGNESNVDEKTNEVEEIICPHIDCLEFKQLEKVDLWVNEQAYKGKTRITNDREIRVSKDVDHSSRHWWIITSGFLEEIDPPLRQHADIFDLLITLTLSTEDPVFFSQDPGQTVGGAYRYRDGGLDYRNDIKPGNIANALLAMHEIPETIRISGDVWSLYESVRKYRSKSISEDEEADLRVALHMYDDAFSSNIWTATTNLYYVCENLLTSGRMRGYEKDEIISDVTPLTPDDAKSWRNTVNRLKHPDKGSEIEGFVDLEEVKIPALGRMKLAADQAIKTSLPEFDF